jgi:hypothetical protein
MMRTSQTRRRAIGQLCEIRARPGKFQTGGPCELILTAGCELPTVRFVGTVTCYLTR